MQDKPQNESVALDEQLNTSTYTKNLGKVQKKWRN